MRFPIHKGEKLTIHFHLYEWQELFRFKYSSWTHKDSKFTTVWYSLLAGPVDLVYYPYGIKPTAKKKISRARPPRFYKLMGVLF